MELKLPVVKDTVNIRIDSSTKDELSALGKHGDSFNSIIEQLLIEHEILDEVVKKYPDGIVLGNDRVTRFGNFYALDPIVRSILR